MKFTCEVVQDFDGTYYANLTVGGSDSNGVKHEPKLVEGLPDHVDHRTLRKAIYEATGIEILMRKDMIFEGNGHKKYALIDATQFRKDCRVRRAEVLTGWKPNWNYEESLTPDGIQPDYVFDTDYAINPTKLESYQVCFNLTARFDTRVWASTVRQALKEGAKNYKSANFGKDFIAVKGALADVHTVDGLVLWEKDTPSSRIKLPEGKYIVEYEIDGTFTAIVKAGDVSEAIGLAKQAYEEAPKKAEDNCRDADFGAELDVIDSEALNVKDEHGNIIWGN